MLSRCRGRGELKYPCLGIVSSVYPTAIFCNGTDYYCYYDVFAKIFFKNVSSKAKTDLFPTLGKIRTLSSIGKDDVLHCPLGCLFNRMNCRLPRTTRQSTNRIESRRFVRDRSIYIEIYKCCPIWFPSETVRDFYLDTTSVSIPWLAPTGRKQLRSVKIVSY